MNTKFTIFLLILLMLPNIALAYNPYGEIYTYEVYYNDELLTGAEVAKPTLKIGEPFSVRIDLTVNQKSDVYVELTETGKNDFEIISGPTSRMDVYSDGDVCEAGSTQVYKWIVKPTDNWAGGSMPLNIYYTILEHGNPDPLVSSGFTIAVPYISTEYYDGDTTSITTTDPTSTDDPTTPSTPAFTILAAVLALTIAARRS
ncbi:MAG TPA: sarcinarray family MAST domain-containing protein [Methanosarcinaceae archaeon]|nr:sarcinarray family MAST domain-containing protein [Methanosarcinaceae archaeon]